MNLKKINSILGYFVLTSLLFVVIIISINYQFHPDYLNFKANRKRQIIHTDDVYLIKMKAISELYQIKYSGIENANEEFNLVYDIQMAISNAKMRGILVLDENGRQQYSSYVTKKESQKLESYLQKKLHQLERKKHSNTENIFVPTNSHTHNNLPVKAFFELYFDNQFDSLRKTQCNSPLLLNIKAIFRLSSEDEINYFTKINKSYSSLPLYLTNSFSELKNQSFFTELVNELARLSLGNENAFSHGFISNNYFVKYQIDILTDFEKTHPYFNSQNKVSQIKEISMIQNNFAIIMAKIIYYITVIGLVYLFLVKMNFIIRSRS